MQTTFIIWIQHHLHPHADLFFQIITYFGSFSGVVLLTALVLWTISYRVGIALLLGNLLTQYIGSLWLKALIALPRPFQASADVLAIVPEHGFSFPSGHAINAVMTLGTLAWCVRRRTVTALAVGGIVLIGLSRIYLGLHYPMDIIGGYALGGLGLWVVIRVMPKLQAWNTTIGWPGKVLGCLAVAAVLAAPLLAFGSVGIPLQWAIFAFIIYCGACVGAIFNTHWVHFTIADAVRQRGWCALVGYGVLLPLLMRFPQSAWMYFAAILWVTIGAPWLFEKMRLTQRAVSGATGRRVGCLVCIVLGSSAVHATAHAYQSGEMIIHTARHEGNSLGARRWRLPPRRCGQLVDYVGAAIECTVQATANGMAAIVSFVTQCGGDLCDGQQWLSIAKGKPIRLPDSLWGGSLELLPSLHAIVADHVAMNARTRHVDVSTIRYDLKTAQVTPFAACESPTLSPGGQWIVCRHANGDALRVSTKGERPQRVYRAPMKAEAIYRAPHSWALNPVVEFPTREQMQITTHLREGEDVRDTVAWTE
ncbi:MAG: phosphatase PAP2 family protein [Deltaproteobacteria bacterium]|nr:phosphatase PAP2 family protein [Deltaproteobacteria bacterium]